MSASVTPGIVPLKQSEFHQIRRMAYQQFGLNLRDGKEGMVSARLGKKLREMGFRSFQEYYEHVKRDPSGESLAAMIDALTTNYTSFFREMAHFDFLRATVLPQLRVRGRMSIWSAACSTGEEPYSIAFALLDALGETAAQGTRILASDISTQALTVAGRAVYPQERFAEMAPDLMRRYLLKGSRHSEGYFLVKRQVRAMVEFRRVNLMDDLSHLGSFSVIFCRNVMIYFDKPTQQRVAARLASRLLPGGYLFIGHSESLNMIDHPLDYIQPAIYRKPGARSDAGAARR